MKLYQLGEFHGHVVASQRIDDVVFAITKRSKSHTVPVHAHAHQSLITLISGDHHYTTDDGKIRWSMPDTWYYSPPNIPHTHDACSTDILAAGIHFNSKSLKHSLAPNLRITGETARFTQKTITSELEKKNPNQQILTGVFQILLGTLTQTTKSDYNDHPDWLIKLKTQIDTSPLTPITVTELANHYAIDPSHLSRAFRHHFGQSLSDYIRDRRLEWAYQQITTTDKKLGEIAISANFTDHAHLCRMFKRRYGKSPSNFR